MKNLKSVLAVVLALCLMLSLTVPVFATSDTAAVEATAAATEAAAAESTGAAEETAGAVEETANATEEATKGEEEHDHDHEEESVTTTGQSEKKAPSAIKVVLIVFEVIASVALIVVVMLQSGKEAGLSGALSGNSDSYLSKSGKGLDKTLARATKWVALAWLILTLVLCLLP